MGQESSGAARGSPRDEVLRELATFLRDRTGKDGKALAFLDRPIVLTLLGTIVLTLITQWWQASEQRHTLALQRQQILLDHKFEFLRQLSTDYNKQSNLLNEYMMFSAGYKLAAADPVRSKDKKALDASRVHILELLREYRQCPPLAGTLLSINALFVSDNVHTKVGALRREWDKFQSLTNELDTASPQELSSKRVSEMQTLEKASDSLLDAMAADLAAGPRPVE